MSSDSLEGFIFSSRDHVKDSYAVIEKCHLRFERNVKSIDTWRRTHSHLERTNPTLASQLSSAYDYLARANAAPSPHLPVIPPHRVVEHLIRYMEILGPDRTRGDQCVAYLRYMCGVSPEHARTFMTRMLLEWGSIVPAVECAIAPTSFEESAWYVPKGGLSSSRGRLYQSGAGNNSNNGNAPLSHDAFVECLGKLVVIFETMPDTETAEIGEHILYLYPSCLNDNAETRSRWQMFLGAVWQAAPIVEQLTALGSCPRTYDDPAVVRCEGTNVVIRQIATQTCYRSLKATERPRRLYLIVGGSPSVSVHTTKARAQIIYRSLLFFNGPLDTVVDHIKSSNEDVDIEASFRTIVERMAREIVCYITGNLLHFSNEPSLDANLRHRDRLSVCFPFTFHLPVVNVSQGTFLCAARLLGNACPSSAVSCGKPELPVSGIVVHLQGGEHNILSSSVPPDISHFMVSRVRDSVTQQSVDAAALSSSSSPGCSEFCVPESSTRGGRYEHVHRSFVEINSGCTMPDHFVAYSVFLTRDQIDAVKAARTPLDRDVEEHPAFLMDLTEYSPDDIIEAENALSRFGVNRNTAVADRARVQGFIDALREGKSESDDGQPLIEGAYLTPLDQANMLEDALKALLWAHQNAGVLEASSGVCEEGAEALLVGKHLFRVNSHLTGKYMGVAQYSVGPIVLCVLVPITSLRDNAALSDIKAHLRSQASLMVELRAVVRPSSAAQQQLQRLDHAGMQCLAWDGPTPSAACTTNSVLGSHNAVLSGHDDSDHAFLAQCTFASSLLHRVHEREHRVLPMPCDVRELPRVAPYPVAAQRVILKHASGRSYVYARGSRRQSWYYRHGDISNATSGSVGRTSSGRYSDLLRSDTTLQNAEDNAHEYFEDQLKFPISN
eukprot:PhM_4_TR16161/c0_g1_i1/m.20690